jgi:hypothetical protein
MAHTNEVYGRSDLQSFSHENHNHVFTDKKNRKLFPGYGDEERTLPVLPCVQCRDFATKHLGFNADPTKVELTTDEQEYLERFTREGSMETQLAMKEGFKAMGEMFAAQRKAQATKA